MVNFRINACILFFRGNYIERIVCIGMDNMLLHLFLLIIVIVVFAQIFKAQNHADRPLVLGFIFGILGAFGYNYWKSHNKPKIHKFYLDVNDICDAACKKERENRNSDKNSRAALKSQKQSGAGEIYTDFPTDFNFGQNPKYAQVVPDGWVDQVEGVKVSNRKYDIDGHIINGNIVGSANKYDDEYWLNLQKPLGEDTFTAANLHMGRKPREAFYYQSRWGQNSIRPWIQAELNDHANKIWWEDNPDLEQFM